MTRVSSRALRQFASELLTLSVASVVLWALFRFWLYPALGLPAQGPLPVRTLIIVLLISHFIARRQESWEDFGLRRPAQIGVILSFAGAFFAAKLVLVQPLSDAVRGFLELPKADHSFFDHLQGNPAALALWLCIAWLIGGFGEEFVFRGYLMRRIAQSVRGGAPGWAIALIAQAALFGTMHFYLGAAGILSAAVSAFFYGVFFLAAGRNLWPVILVHAVWDSLALTLIYLRGVPSTG